MADLWRGASDTAVPSWAHGGGLGCTRRVVYQLSWKHTQGQNQVKQGADFFKPLKITFNDRTNVWRFLYFELKPARLFTPSTTVMLFSSNWTFYISP